MHIHVGVIQALVVFADVIVIGLFWRLIASWNADNVVGQAMSFLF